MPSATQEELQRIIERCRVAGLPVKRVPSYNALVEGQARIGQLQEVNPESLLSRTKVAVDRDAISQEIKGARVLVTGAGGSIGSELCRQIASLEPEHLVMIDRAESSLYFLHLELSDRFPDLKISPVICDVLDIDELREHVSAHAPEFIYHAAAYKHVPLMEDHPLDAIQNNIFGTEAVAQTALEVGARRFVLISTDKAVRPVSVMGMTKRVAEDLLRSYQGTSTVFSSVRFGNVLGSAGSVMPLFQWQMAQGKPITITDPEATRYFMLTAEAAQLVLQAGVIGRGGEVFFLDMGEPIKIIDLAEDLIRLSGYKPGEDIRVDTVGMRPGERMNEELVREAEALLESSHEKIMIAQSPPLDPECFSEDLETLRRLAVERKREPAVEHLKAMAVRYSAVSEIAQLPEGTTPEV